MRDILIVEDNDGLREILKEAFSTEGSSVYESASAEQAFAALEKRILTL